MFHTQTKLNAECSFRNLVALSCVIENGEHEPRPNDLNGKPRFQFGWNIMFRDASQHYFVDSRVNLVRAYENLFIQSYLWFQ